MSVSTREVGSWRSRVPNSLNAAFALSARIAPPRGLAESTTTRRSLSIRRADPVSVNTRGSARGVLAFPERLAPPSRSHTRSAISGPGGVDHHAPLSQHPARRPRVCQHSGGWLAAFSRSHHALRRLATSGPGGADHGASLSQHSTRRPRVCQYTGGGLAANRALVSQNLRLVRSRPPDFGLTT